MAGDDLESDDEYLDQSWAGRNETVSVALDESIQQNNDSGVNTALGSGKKRGSSELQNLGEGDGDGGDDTSSSKKKKKSMSSKQLLLEAGRGIAEETAEVQAQFLWTCFTNVLKLRGEEIPDQKFNSSVFKKSTKNDDRNEVGASSSSQSKYDPSFSKFLKSGVLSSAKKLKKWKHTKSPMVIIICASARRAVSILKEISSLNVRAAKLFAKHMSIADQTAMLENNKYSIAVGTPNRLLKLTEEREFDDTDAESGAESDAPLSLDQTELIIIDCHEDKKRFTVCTLNDTAPDLMVFIKEAVLPQLKRRKTLKLALF